MSYKNVEEMVKVFVGTFQSQTEDIKAEQELAKLAILLKNQK